ncbi:MAG: DUF4837 family protein [Bacteroidota bacterium]
MKIQQKINWKSLIKVLCFFAIGVFAMTSCSEEARTRLSAKSNAFGKANHVVVIADKDVWEGEVGDTFRFYFSSAYLILPQPEPILDLKHFTPLDLEKDPIRRELRTYIYLSDMKDESSPTAALMLEDVGSERVRSAKEGKGYGNIQKRDKWAVGQLNVYMYGTSKESLLTNIKNNYSTILKKIRENDEELIAANVYAGGESRKAEDNVSQSLGIQLKVPADYFVAMDDENTMWIRKMTKEFSSNILLHKTPYTAKEQLSYEGIRSLRDSLTKRYISSDVENSYMLVNDVDLPMFVKSVEFNDLYAMEAKGIWELNNDFMGGPFISYLIHNPDSNELYLLDGFVFAPSKDKRELMQYLEHILNTAVLKT